MAQERRLLPRQPWEVPQGADIRRLASDIPAVQAAQATMGQIRTADLGEVELQVRMDREVPGVRS